MMRRLLALLLTACATLHAADEDPPGKWSKPPADGSPWKHKGTGLSFPQILGSHRLAAEFRYDTGGGVFIRYESADDRARADIFFFPHSPAPTTPRDEERVLEAEMDTVVKNLEQMVAAGRYKNLVLGDFMGTEIPQWHKDPLPLAVRNLTVTRLARTDAGMQERTIEQWVGVTLYQGHLITIRHIRPAETKTAGEEALKAFVSLIFQVIKDPPLRADVIRMLGIYLEDPLSTAGQQASTIVVSYLDQTPFFPIGLPEKPLAAWLQHAKDKAPGTEAQLIAAFMCGAAKSAFDGGDADACLAAGARQLATIYTQLRALQPALAHPEMDEFATRTEKGEGAQYLQEKAAK